MAMILARMRLVLLLSVMSVFWATSPVQAQDACQAVAEQVRAFSPPVWEKEPPRTALLALNNLPKGVLHIRPGRSLTPQEVVGVLRDDFKATAAILDPATRLSGIRGVHFILSRFGQSPLYAIEMVNGYFEFFDFFGVTPDGRADVTAESAAMTDPLRLSCSYPDHAARVGDLNGVPAFICESGTDQDEVIRIIQPQSGVWRQSCEISLHFSAEFKSVEQFCHGVNCALASDLALAQVKQHEKTPFGLPNSAELAIWKSEKYQRLLKVISGLQQGPTSPDPPYFNKPDTNAPVYVNSRDSFLKPFVLEGETYIARFGHAYSSAGYSIPRTYPDYLFAVYRLVNDQLEPVAGFYIMKTLSAPFVVMVK